MTQNLIKKVVEPKLIFEGEIDGELLQRYKYPYSKIETLIVTNNNHATRYDVDYEDLNKDGLKLYGISSDNVKPRMDFIRPYRPLNTSYYGIKFFIDAQRKFELYILKIETKVTLDKIVQTH